MTLHLGLGLDLLEAVRLHPASPYGLRRDKPESVEVMAFDLSIGLDLFEALGLYR